MQGSKRECYDSIDPTAVKGVHFEIGEVKAMQQNYTLFEDSTKKDRMELEMKWQDRYTRHQKLHQASNLDHSTKCDWRDWRKDGMKNSVRAGFHWGDITTNVPAFIQSCIHCFVSRTGEQVPRLLATALHGRVPNEVAHIDFLHLKEAFRSHLKYVLLPKDAITSHT